MKTQKPLMQAFTLLELLVVIALIWILAALIIPSPHRNTRVKAQRIQCVNNLKQVGLAFRVWTTDNQDQFPMNVSTNRGGSMELAILGDALTTFQTLSNELFTPKVLVCPSDAGRTHATNFIHFGRSNVSYFVAADAIATNATMLLTGDRNITNGTKLRNGLLELSTNTPSGWTSALHNRAGNIGLTDGSVQQVTTYGLRAAIEQTGVTNQIALP